MTLSGFCVDRLGTKVAERVVEKLEGNEELQQLLMDTIGGVIFEHFGADGVDEDLEMDISMDALQRIVLTVN